MLLFVLFAAVFINKLFLANVVIVAVAVAVAVAVVLLFLLFGDC